MRWTDKVELNEGEKILRGQKREKGHLGQEEIFPFTIVDSDGLEIGSGTYTEHTTIRGLHNSYHLEYTKKDGKNFRESW
ncbi:hypothetical protein [Acinetobacter lactucae]|uniref:hypothetical protein n=1 Tax=Acinetobacter lactucae TaxID=1785128 RepID=UPI0003DF8F69|nr:hypothetical protein [Acinetobacter lactucae]ETR94527.1 hypothetical protein M211_2190 [Acinetobacter lactucae]